MKSFIANELKRTVIIRLRKGELLLESITHEAEKLGLKNGIVVSGVGALRKLVYHIVRSTDDLPDNGFITINAPIELGSIQGLIIEGVPHLHVSCSSPDGQYIGHLENGSEVLYLAEICIIEIPDLNLERKTDEFGIKYLDYKN